MIARLDSETSCGVRRWDDRDLPAMVDAYNSCARAGVWGPAAPTVAPRDLARRLQRYADDATVVFQFVDDPVRPRAPWPSPPFSMGFVQLRAAVHLEPDEVDRLDALVVLPMQVAVEWRRIMARQAITVLAVNEEQRGVRASVGMLHSGNRGGLRLLERWGCELYPSTSQPGLTLCAFDWAALASRGLAWLREHNARVVDSAASG